MKPARLQGHLPKDWEIPPRSGGAITNLSGGPAPRHDRGRRLRTLRPQPDRADAMVWGITELMLEKERGEPRVFQF